MGLTDGTWTACFEYNFTNHVHCSNLPSTYWTKQTKNHEHITTQHHDMINACWGKQLNKNVKIISCMTTRYYMYIKNDHHEWDIWGIKQKPFKLLPFIILLTWNRWMWRLKIYHLWKSIKVSCILVMRLLNCMHTDFWMARTENKITIWRKKVILNRNLTRH